MKKFIAFTLIFLSVNFSYARISVIIPTFEASEIFFPIGKTGQQISLLELSKVKVKDFEILRCQKMDFFDRLSFRVAQKKLRNNINSDGTLNNKKLIKVFTKASEGQKGGGTVLAAVEGFLLGSVLLFIGVPIAYLIKDNHKKTRVLWAWIGFAAFATLVIIQIATGGFAGFAF